MSSIKSVFIPCVEKYFDAEFIADVFSRNDIAEVSRVYIEKNEKNKFNRAYIDIKFWHENETSKKIVQRLQSGSENRIIYNSNGKWWLVKINKDTHKLKKLQFNTSVLTVFREKEKEEEPVDEVEDDLSLQAVLGEEEDDMSDAEPDIDYPKTKLLMDTLYSLRNSEEDLLDFAKYLDEMDKSRALWYSEQYIYDALDM
jgi:hypothetical protein